MFGIGKSKERKLIEWMLLEADAATASRDWPSADQFVEELIHRAWAALPKNAHTHHCPGCHHFRVCNQMHRGDYAWSHKCRDCQDVDNIPRG